MGEIKVNKYILEVTTYPDGKQYTKMYPMKGGATTKKAAVKKVKQNTLAEESTEVMF